MKPVRRLLGYFLNPRSELSGLPRLSQEIALEGQTQTPSAAWRSRTFRKAFLNLPLVFGGFVLLCFLLIVLFGPIWAPFNPYIAGQHIVPHYDPELDKWVSPPLEPSSDYPLGTDEWGNDILSMLLYGARNTLIAAAFVAMARVILGLVLGAYAGWNEGSTGDRIIMGLIGVIAAVPIMISSMILIFALDIRRGLPVFILALTLVGWTEIAQYIRGEFLILRKKPFIEGARSVGSNNLGIAVRHILPNLLPQVLVITFLEVAAVLMVFGELGFVGVYIGGGSHISIGDELTGTEVVTLAEVPEWGAMLAEGYRWLRAKPFIVFPPAVAFFIAVVGFNAFGEGLRRFIETYHVNTNFLLSKRMIVVIAGLTFATLFIINNTGPAPWFARVAQAFDGGSAYAHTEVLSAMDGRGAGQNGATQAAAYIAGKFEQYGLGPGWRRSTYIYPMETSMVRPLLQPSLVLLDGNGSVRKSYLHQLDFGFVIEEHGGGGQVEGPLTFVGFKRPVDAYTWESFKGLDLNGRIVIALENNTPPGFATEALIRGAQGVLWVVDREQYTIPSQYQLADPARYYLRQPVIPIFRIQPHVAQDIVSQAELSLTELLEEDDNVRQTGPGWLARDLNVSVRLSLELGEPQKTTVPTVLGYLHGSDFTISNELVVIFAAYDGLGLEPDGTQYPGANHNAAGIGVLLEVARLWQAEELDPRRSVLFVAWGGGQLENSAAAEFLNSHNSFRHLPADSTGRPLTPAIVIQLDYVGAGDEPFLIHPRSSRRLAELMEQSVAGEGITVNGRPDNGFPAIEVLQPRRAEWLSFAWQNAVISPDQDIIARIDADKLAVVGKGLSHMLTQIVRQTAY